MTLTAIMQPITSTARIASSIQFQGLVARPKRTNPMPRTTVRPSPTAKSAAIARQDPMAAATGQWRRIRGRSAIVEIGTLDVVQLAADRLTPIDPVGGEQADRPVQQPGGRVSLGSSGRAYAHCSTAILLCQLATRSRGMTALRPAQTQTPTRHRPFEPDDAESCHIFPTRRGQSI